MPAQVGRDGVQDALAHVEEGDEDEDQALYQHDSEGLPPGVANGLTQREGEEGVQTHRRSLGEGQLGHDGQQDGGDGRSKGGGGEERATVHACGAEDGWIDGEDVAHRHKCGEAGHQFCADGHRAGVKAK